MKVSMIVAAGAALMVVAPAGAQTTAQTKVSNNTHVDNNGVVTQQHKVTHVTKRKTHHPKKVLGVKVGHKTVTHKTERTTTTDSQGNASTTVKSQ